MRPADSGYSPTTLKAETTTSTSRLKNLARGSPYLPSTSPSATAADPVTDLQWLPALPDGCLLQRRQAARLAVGKELRGGIGGRRGCKAYSVSGVGGELWGGLRVPRLLTSAVGKAEARLVQLGTRA
jgi:hypothetical protein